MELLYSGFETVDLRGDTLADYLIAIDADFQMIDHGEIIYAEPAFPVVELARSLLAWVSNEERGDFVFDSLSFDEPGSVTIVKQGQGWTLGSALTPDAVSSAYPWHELLDCIHRFVGLIRRDLSVREFDAHAILGG